MSSSLQFDGFDGFDIPIIPLTLESATRLVRNDATGHTECVDEDLVASLLSWRARCGAHAGTSTKR